ncbi:MAG: histidine kinase [Saprospiraceae bacterium]|nr:histidine kinase [Saprospiraceae bacterium]
MREKVLGIPVPVYWRMKLIIILSISFTGILARKVVGFRMPPNWELPLTLFSIVAIYLYWELFIRIHQFLNKKLPFEKSIAIRITVQLIIGSLIFLISRQTALYYFGETFGFQFNKQHYVFLIVADIFASFAINLGFISSYFIKRWQENALKAERLQREQATLKYQQLKNQVNPHLLFNSLSSLDNLIRTDPALASRFVKHMSKVYRYVLQHKENEVVNLETELEFINEYNELQKIRFGNALMININVKEDSLEKGIVMITLQTLIDNAIKHNEVHLSKPLNIQIFDKGEYLIIENNKQLKQSIQDSNQQGLAQLTQLYEYLSKEPLIIEDQLNSFTVKIPLL